MYNLLKKEFNLDVQKIDSQDNGIFTFNTGIDRFLVLPKRNSSKLENLNKFINLFDRSSLLSQSILFNKYKESIFVNDGHFLSVYKVSETFGTNNPDFVNIGKMYGQMQKESSKIIPIINTQYLANEHQNFRSYLEIVKRNLNDPKFEIETSSRYSLRFDTDVLDFLISHAEDFLNQSNFSNQFMFNLTVDNFNSHYQSSYVSLGSDILDLTYIIIKFADEIENLTLSEIKDEILKGYIQETGFNKSNFVNIFIDLCMFFEFFEDVRAEEDSYSLEFRKKMAKLEKTQILQYV